MGEVTDCHNAEIDANRRNAVTEGTIPGPGNCDYNIPNLFHEAEDEGQP